MCNWFVISFPLMLIKGIWKTRCFVVSRKDFIYSFPSISNIEFVSVECRF